MAQLSEENVLLKSRELELVERCKALEQQLAKASPFQEGYGSDSGVTSIPSTPTKYRPISCPHLSTPIHPVPGKTELEALQMENEKLKKELQCLQTNFQLTSQKSAAVKKEKKEVEQALAELQSEFDRVLGEKEDTELKLEAAKATLFNKLSSMSTGQGRETELAEEVYSLRAELTEAISQMGELQAKLTVEEGRLAASQEMVRKWQEKSKSLKGWKVKAESDFDALNTHAQELEQKLASHRKSEASHSSSQRHEHEAIVAYKQKLEKVRQEHHELQEQLREACRALDKERSKNGLVEKTNRALKKQLAGVELAQQELQDQREQGSSLSREVDELNDRLAAVTEENSLLREECGRLETEQKQTIEQIEGLIRSRQEQFARADSQEGVVSNLQQQIGRQESDLESAMEATREREAQCVVLTEQIEELQLELANVQSARHHFELEVGELVQKLEELEQCNFELSSKLSDAHNETALAVATSDEHSTQLDELQHKVHDMQALLLEKETQLSEFKYSHKLLQSENVNMVSQVSTLSEMVAARNAKIESLQTEVACYESNTRDIMSQIVTLEEEHGMCAQQRENLQEQIDRNGAFARNAERRERELDDEISSLRSKLREAREQTACIESANRELSQKLQAQAEREDELVSSCQQSEMKGRSLEQDVQEREHAISSLKGELEYATKSSSDVQGSLIAEIESLNGKCCELRAQCEDYREAQLQLKTEILQLQKEISELQTVNSDLRQDRQPLQDHYDDTRSNLVKVQDELYVAQKELKSLKAELRYQKRKRTEAEEQLGGVQGETTDTAAQFELLREELLKILDEGEENTPSVSRRRIKGILKQSKKHILKPLHNIGE